MPPLFVTSTTQNGRIPSDVDHKLSSTLFILSLSFFHPVSQAHQAARLPSRFTNRNTSIVQTMKESSRRGERREARVGGPRERLLQPAPAFLLHLVQSPSPRSTLTASTAHVCSGIRIGAMLNFRLAGSQEARSAEKHKAKAVALSSRLVCAWKPPGGGSPRASERLSLPPTRSSLPAAVSTTLPSIRWGCEQLSLFLARSDTSRWVGKVCCTLLASRDSRAISRVTFQRSLPAPHQ